MRACCVRRLPALDLAADGGTALPGSTLAGTFLVCATLTGARDRRHLACRHLARRRLARQRLARRRLAHSPAPRSSAPRSSAPRSAVPRSAVPRPESPRAPVGQITRPGNRGAWASSVCAAWPCELVRARRPWVARMSGRTHGTPGPGIPCSLPRPKQGVACAPRQPVQQLAGVRFETTS